MHALVFLVASAGVGVDAGWTPLPGGGHEYTIQIEPELLKVLERGTDLVSEVPPQIDVRRYRITTSRETLQRDYGPPPKRLDDAAQRRDDAAQRGWRIEPDEDTGRKSVAAENDAPHQFTIDSDLQPLGDRGASFNEPTRDYNADKPALPAEAAKPWLPLIVAAVLLCCSLGANFYLGWIAYEARARYRDVVSRFRPSAGNA